MAPDEETTPPTDPERPAPDASGESSTGDAAGGDDEDTTRAGFDLKAVLRQLTTPMVESLDARLRDQVEAHVDELLEQKVDAAIRDRLSTLDRAIADLSRSLEELERRIASPPTEG